MLSSLAKAAAQRVWFDADDMWVELTDGRRLAIPLAWFPRLLHATPQQREQFEMSGGGTGLHWDAIDEDISVEGLLLGIGDQTARHRSAPNPASPSG